MRSPFISWPLALGAWLSLAACSSAGAPPAATPAPPGTAADADLVRSGQPPANRCDAKAAQFLVGQPYTAATLAEARAAAGADEARLLRPGTVTTRDYKVGRLNVVVDEAQRVLRVHCG